MTDTPVDHSPVDHPPVNRGQPGPPGPPLLPAPMLLPAPTLLPAPVDRGPPVDHGPPGPPGPTLLPAPVAQAVSLATRSTSLAIRVGSLVGSYGLDAARFTALSSLELARGMVEGALSRAARDALASDSPLAAAEAESTLERSLETLHHAVAQVVFWTSAGFRLTGSTLAAASDASRLLLSSLDQLFGSTDSSRAVASIVTLVRREFSNPATGTSRERVGVVDLVLALAALAYLQQACHRSPAEERRRQACQDVIWDVVVLSDGERVDVDDDGPRPSPDAAAHVYDGPGPGPGADDGGHGSDDDEAMLARLKNQIMASMSPGTTVSVSNAVSSVQTITVDVQGARLPTLPTPPGAEIVETRGPSSAVNRRSWTPMTPRGHDGDASYRVVYRIHRDKLGSSSFRRQDEASGPAVVELTDDGPGLAPGPDPDRPPEPGPSSPSPPKTASATSPAPAASTGGPRRPQPTQEPAANQKKQRSPLTRARRASDAGKRKGEAAEKKGGLKQVLRVRQPLASIWNKEPPEAGRASHKPRPQGKAPGGGSPDAKQHTLAARRSLQPPEPIPRSGSRGSCVSVHEHRRGSVVSQTDSYSMLPNGELRPASPTIVRKDFSAHESTVRPRSDACPAGSLPPSPHKGHRRSASYAPSLYGLAANDSQSSLVLSSYYQKSAYGASDALSTLRREGFVDGAFPAGHLLSNIARYMRFSSACYGSHFLKFMGISTELPALGVWDGTHHDVRHFAHHTESEAGNILLASFVDPQGGADGSGSTGTGVPLVHYVSLDHAAKAVVLACRGTLGFEDVMADMTCEYDDLTWRGRRCAVHKGIHASARRLLYGDDGRVLLTIQEALREFPDYGLVLCGHSLGGGVTSLLGVMLAQPNPDGPGFVTSAEEHGGGAGDLRLPAGRRIHVYAYGPPGVMSSALRRMTRGLITSVVHGNDLVPHLSLGLLHDFQALALAFKTDENKTKAEMRQRVWRGLQSSLAERWHRAGPRAPGEADEQWTQPALEALRASMRGAKLVPPGEVFAIESQRVLRRDAFVGLGDGPVGRPAERVVLMYIRDVEARFGEVRFGTSMLTDHSPAKYEDALNQLRLGVVE